MQEEDFGFRNWRILDCGSPPLVGSIGEGCLRHKDPDVDYWDTHSEVSILILCLEQIPINLYEIFNSYKLNNNNISQHSNGFYLKLITLNFKNIIDNY